MERKIITQIGSLPYEDVEEAVEYSLRHDIPFLPELPKRGDLMLDYIKNPGKLSCLSEFKKQLKRNKYATVKIQCIGPATLISNGYSKDEAVRRAHEHISGIMDGLNAEEIILFLDEPSLERVNFDYRELWTSLFNSFNVIPGVHNCGNMNWNKLFNSDVEIISFDASNFDIINYPEYKSIRGNKKISWGIKKREDIKDFQEGDLLTLPCGMSPLKYSVGDCKKNLENLVSISRELFS